VELCSISADLRYFWLESDGQSASAREFQLPQSPMSISDKAMPKAVGKVAVRIFLPDVHCFVIIGGIPRDQLGNPSGFSRDA
jgi:hypothetical protein